MKVQFQSALAIKKQLLSTMLLLASSWQNAHVNKCHRICEECQQTALHLVCLFVELPTVVLDMDEIVVKMSEATKIYGHDISRGQVPASQMV